MLQKFVIICSIVLLTTPLCAKEKWEKKGDKWEVTDTVVIKTLDRAILEEAIAYRQRQIDNLQQEIIKTEAEKKTFEDDLTKLAELEGG